MKNKYPVIYGVFALVVVFTSVLWFVYSLSKEVEKGIREAQNSFDWLRREASAVSFTEGFMTDSYIKKLETLCRQSGFIAAITVSTPSGTVFAWPSASPYFTHEASGTISLSSNSPFVKVFSTSLDIGDQSAGSVMMTAAASVLLSQAVYAASRNSFLLILAVLFITLLIILGTTLDTIQGKRPVRVSVKPAAPIDPIPSMEPIPSIDPVVRRDEVINDTYDDDNDTVLGTETAVPEGLFSPLTGIGWQQYLEERLDSELVRAASSEQDLSLIILRVSGLTHTDLLSRKVSELLVETFKFKDMIFEFGSDGFAGILQNVNLDMAMKIADGLYADIDALIIDLCCQCKIAIGITTRTARLLPASRMIEEAVNAAAKAKEESELPIVAFRANPDKYRNYVAEQNA